MSFWHHAARFAVEFYGLPGLLRDRLALIEEKVDRLGSQPGSVNIVVSWMTQAGLPRIESFESRGTMKGELVRQTLPVHEGMKPPIFIVVFGGRLQVVQVGTTLYNLAPLGRFSTIGESVPVGAAVVIEAVSNG